MGARGANYPFLTSKERDVETRLDYFFARYYSSVQGRFTSVDPESAGASPDDPQSWNSYAHARSCPVVLSDPDGRKYLLCSLTGKDCVEYDDDDFWAIRRDGTDGYTFSGSGDFFEVGTIFDAHGNPIANYRQVSIDDPVREFSYEMREAFNDPALTARAARNLLFLGALRRSTRRGSARTSVTSAAPTTMPNLTRLSQNAASPDRGGLSKAGRSLTKHGAGQRAGNSKVSNLFGKYSADKYSGSRDRGRYSYEPWHDTRL